MLGFIQCKWKKKIHGLPRWLSGKESFRREDLLEEEMATHSSILAWRIPRRESGGLQSRGLQSQTQLSTHTYLKKSIFLIECILIYSPKQQAAKGPEAALSILSPLSKGSKFLSSLPIGCLHVCMSPTIPWTLQVKRHCLLTHFESQI